MLAIPKDSTIKWDGAGAVNYLDMKILERPCGSGDDGLNKTHDFLFDFIQTALVEVKVDIESCDAGAVDGKPGQTTHDMARLMRIAIEREFGNALEQRVGH